MRLNPRVLPGNQVSLSVVLTQSRWPVDLPSSSARWQHGHQELCQYLERCVSGKCDDKYILLYLLELGVTLEGRWGLRIDVQPLPVTWTLRNLSSDLAEGENLDKGH